MSSIPSEFEEKEFEAPLYNQLERDTHQIWAPGQVFERYVGIDRAMKLDDPRLWRFFNIVYPPTGALLGHYDWRFIWRNRSRRSFPNFRLNLFLQAKRSHYYRLRPRHLKKVMSSGPCWRFDVDKAQQDALGRLAVTLGARAVVAYAAPAFHRLSQLNAHTIRGSILANCTFPLARSLNGHSAWYYVGPGGNGFANPEPEQIEGMGFDQILEQLSAGRLPENESDSPSAQLRLLAEAVLRTLKDLPDDNTRKVWFFDRLRQLEPVVGQYEREIESARDFVQVATFAVVFNADWYVIG